MLKRNVPGARQIAQDSELRDTIMDMMGHVRHMDLHGVRIAANGAFLHDSVINNINQMQSSSYRMLDALNFQVMKLRELFEAHFEEPKLLEAYSTDELIAEIHRRIEKKDGESWQK